MGRTLTTRAAIVGVDQLSGPFAKIANRVRGINAELKQSFAKMGAGGALTSVGATSGLVQLVEKTREYQETLWGIKAASAAENNDFGIGGDGVLNVQKLNSEVEKTHEKIFELSKRLKLMPEDLAKSAEAATKMNVPIEKLNGYMQAAGLVKLSDREADIKGITEALGTYNALFGDANKHNVDDEKLQMRRASRLALIGNLTKSSASKIEEGMRNVAGMSAGFGISFEETLAVIGASVDAGQMEKEAGTSLKSLLGRMLRMPLEGTGALARAGIDRSKFMEMVAQDPTRATNQIVSMFPQQLGKNMRGKLFSKLEKDMGQGLVEEDGYAQHLYGWMRRNGAKFKASTQEDIERILGKIEGATRRPGEKINLIGMLEEYSKALQDGRMSPADLGVIGEGKRQHQTAILVKQMERSKKLLAALEGDDGHYLRRIEELRKVDPAGIIAGIEASWRRMYVTLARSPAILSLTENIESLVENLSSLSPATANALVKLGLIAAVGGPLIMAARVLRVLGMAAWGMTAAFARTAAIPFMAMAAGLSRFMIPLTLFAGLRLGTVFGPAVLGGLMTFLGIAGRLMRLGVIGLVGGGILSMIMGPETALKAFDEFTSSPAVSNLVSSVKTLFGNLNDAGNSILKLFGFNGEGSALYTTLIWLIEKLTWVVDKVNGLFKPVNTDGVDVTNPNANGSRDVYAPDGTLLFKAEGDKLGEAAKKQVEAADVLKQAADRLGSIDIGAAMGGRGGGASAPPVAVGGGGEYGRFGRN